MSCSVEKFIKPASSACAVAVRTAVPELQNGSGKKHCHFALLLLSADRNDGNV